LVDRVYADFLLPSRLEDFRAVLRHAIARGYVFHSVASYWRVLQSGERKDSRVAVLRVDVDTDPGTAGELFRSARELGVAGSYYFRLSTFDVDLMRLIDRHGSEVSYHFEEIATMAKERRLRSREAVVRVLPEIRRRFLRNLSDLRQRVGAPMRTVASHGDFVNRRLRMPNLELLDEATRAAGQIEVEAYDAAFYSDGFTSRCGDRSFKIGEPPGSAKWRPIDPRDAFDRGERAVHILTHPRQWRSSVTVNLVDDVRRMWEGVRYG
jgi:hypothetical protein